LNSATVGFDDSQPQGGTNSIADPGAFLSAIGKSLLPSLTISNLNRLSAAIMPTTVKPDAAARRRPRRRSTDLHEFITDRIAVSFATTFVAHKKAAPTLEPLQSTGPARSGRAGFAGLTEP
jgi:hypothetical protein